MTASSEISKSEGVRKFLFPQKYPRKTAYTQERESPISKIRKTGKLRISEKRKVIFSPKSPKKRAQGRDKSRQPNSPAEREFCSPCRSFSALHLEIMRETVMGIPPVPMVTNSPKRERATWYKPKPSAPISRERTMRYRKPRVRSATDSPVTIEAFL